MDENRLKLLLDKHNEGTLSPSEKQVLDEWFHNLHLGRIDFETLMEQAGGPGSYTDQRFNAFKQQIIPIQRSARIIPIRWAAAAAAVLIIISSAVLFFPSKRKQTLIAYNQPVLLPGLNKATLTLSNGRKVTLSSGNYGVIAKQANVTVKMSSDGTVSYAGRNDNHPLAYNMVNTPRGGKVTTIKLPDGTIAILDASSSIKYLVSFAKNERRVEVTGQVYFDVVHDAERPFKVIAAGQTIEDLGTHFNVNAYSEEPNIKVTLEQGSVKVFKGSKSIILIPGQQSLTNSETGLITIKNANVNAEISWINGKILFESKNIQEIMRQVSRWYDVDVEYKGTIPKQTFTGGITKSDDLPTMLKVLELNGIKYETSGRKVIIKF